MELSVCPLFRRVRSARGPCRGWTLAMLIFCNTPEESQRGLIFANVTLLLSCQRRGRMVLPAGRRAKRDDHALVPVAFEIGFVFGAVRAGVPARDFVRRRASPA